MEKTHAQDDPHSSSFGAVFFSSDGSIDGDEEPSHDRSCSPERQHVQRRYGQRHNEQEKDDQIGKNEEKPRQDVTLTRLQLDRLRAVFLFGAAGRTGDTMWFLGRHASRDVLPVTTENAVRAFEELTLRDTNSIALKESFNRGGTVVSYLNTMQATRRQP
jgi:hypothetical protein